MVIREAPIYRHADSQPVPQSDLMHTDQPRLLIIDNEPPLLRALCDSLDGEGFQVTGFLSAMEALASIHEDAFDIVLTDLVMPEMDGITLLGKAFEIDPNLAGIVMTGHSSVHSAVEALQTGAVDYIVKPFKLGTLLPILNRAVANRRLKMENIQLREAAALHAVSLSIAAARDGAEVLEKVRIAALQQSKAQRAWVWVVSDDGAELCRASDGQAGSHLQRIPLIESLREWAVGWGTEPTRQLAAPLPSDSWETISVPMIAAGKLVGVIQMELLGPARNPAGTEPPAPARRLTPGQVKALHILAGAAASALAAATLMERLAATEQRYRELTEYAPDIVWRYELLPDPGFTYVNPAVTAVTGYSPQDFYADPGLAARITHPEDRDLAVQALAGTTDGSSITLRWIHKSGANIWIEQRNTLLRDREGRITAIESISRDITERKNLQDRLQHTQKLEAMGRLTAGVAHDFNNLLTVINGYASLALNEVDRTASAWRRMREVKKAGEYAAGLTAQLLAFSRKQIVQPRPVNLAGILTSMDLMIRRAAGETVEVSIRLPEEVGNVRMDPIQVQQVVLNLTVNARDAMPQGGQLRLTLADVMVADSVPDLARPGGGIPAGAYIRLTVIDTGCGMSPEVKQHMFEPFFTTKGQGRGTGLGLATVQGIVEQCSAHILAESEVGVGTTFTIYFPRCEEPAEPEVVEGEVSGGDETILLVEDAPPIRTLVTGILEQVGYTVLVAGDAEEAVERARQHSGHIDLLLTDIGLPKISGWEVADQIRAMRPEIRVLYMTGYSEVADESGGVEAFELIRKPFAPHELCRRIRSVLPIPEHPCKTILVVDDDESIRDLLCEILQAAGFTVETASDGKVAERLTGSFDLVITDLMMPDVEGIELIGRLRRANPNVKIIAMSGAFVPDLLRAAKLLGANATLPKPLSRADVLDCVRQTL